MLYDVVLISAVQYSDSVIHTHTHTFFYMFFSGTVYHRTLNKIPCITQEGLAVYPFSIQ